MRKLLRWLGIGLGGLVGILLVAAIVIFAISEVVLRKSYAAAAEPLPKPSAALLADAPRQARILGCLSCHGEGLTGKMMFDAPPVARVLAPNLTHIAARVTDQQLAAAIRQGIGHDGRPLFIMPSPMYSRMSYEETAALIAWMRGLPKVGEPSEPLRYGPIGRFALATGKFEPAPAAVERFKRQAPIDLGVQHSAGRRLAANTCAECHGPALFGQEMPEGSKPPDLNVVAGYNAEQFRTLLRTGNTPGGNKLGLMAEVSRNDFRYFNDAEIDALYAYLTARAKKLGS